MPDSPNIVTIVVNAWLGDARPRPKDQNIMTRYKINNTFGPEMLDNSFVATNWVCLYQEKFSHASAFVQWAFCYKWTSKITCNGHLLSSYVKRTNISHNGHYNMQFWQNVNLNSQQVSVLKFLRLSGTITNKHIICRYYQPKPSYTVDKFSRTLASIVDCKYNFDNDLPLVSRVTLVKLKNRFKNLWYIGRIANENVTVVLVIKNCLSILLYAFKVSPLTKSDIRPLDYVVDSALKKNP